MICWKQLSLSFGLCVASLLVGYSLHKVPESCFPAARFSDEEVQVLKEWVRSPAMQEIGRPHKPGAF